jgi:hypothetical protein
LDENAILSDVHSQRVAGAGFQVVGRNGNRTDVNPCQDVSVCRVGEGVVNRTPVIQVSNENGHVVVGISAGIVTGTGPEKDN